MPNDNGTHRLYGVAATMLWEAIADILKQRVSNLLILLGYVLTKYTLFAPITIRDRICAYSARPAVGLRELNSKCP